MNVNELLKGKIIVAFNYFLNTVNYFFFLHWRFYSESEDLTKRSIKYVATKAKPPIKKAKTTAAGSASIPKKLCVKFPAKIPIGTKKNNKAILNLE